MRKFVIKFSKRLKLNALIKTLVRFIEKLKYILYNLFLIGLRESLCSFGSASGEYIEEWVLLNSNFWFLLNEQIKI